MILIENNDVGIAIDDGAIPLYQYGENLCLQICIERPSALCEMKTKAKYYDIFLGFYYNDKCISIMTLYDCTITIKENKIVSIKYMEFDK